MRPTTTTAIALVACLLLAACGESAEDEVADAPSDPPAEEPDEPDDDEPDGPDEPADDDLDGEEDPVDLDEAVEMAVADAAGRADLDPDDIAVIEAEQVTWPDGAMGCPDDDEMYTQALIDGYRIELEVAGEVQHYHAGQGQPPFPCDDPQPPAET